MNCIAKLAVIMINFQKDCRSMVINFIFCCAQSSQNNSPNAGVGEKREHLYKILVIGELGAGKTSIIKRYVHQFFSQHYRATIGVDFALKVLNWDPHTIIRLQLWDIAGWSSVFSSLSFLCQHRTTILLFAIT